MKVKVLKSKQTEFPSWWTPVTIMVKGEEEKGLQSKGLLVGDPMYDAFVEYSNRMSLKDIKLELLQGGVIVVPDMFYYLTCHREENTNNDDVLLETILQVSPS